MFAHGVRDILKSQWVAVIEQLKLHGALSIPELKDLLEMSYMGIKQQCEALRKHGYLERIRVARTNVGRPEISYRLTEKADELFPQAGVQFTMELLELLRPMFGDSAPEKILRHYFDAKKSELLPRMRRAKSLVEKATLLVSLREKEGCFSRCSYDPQNGFRIEEFHNPLWAIFESYPAAVAMELRAMEELVGSRIDRREIPGGRGGPARVEYLIPTL